MDATGRLKSSSDGVPPHAALADLTGQRLAAAEAIGPVLVLAGAGTGKTKTLKAAVIHRIQACAVSPSRILAVTFTNKVAGEMIARIRAGVGQDAAPHRIGTFHGLAARQLRIEPEVAGLRPGFDILGADDSRWIVKRIMKAFNLAAGDEGMQIGRDPLKVMCNRLSKFRDNLLIPGVWRDAYSLPNESAAASALLGRKAQRRTENESFPLHTELCLASVNHAGL